MKSDLYKFDFKDGLLDQKTFKVRDYFQYYHGGAGEDIIRNYPDAVRITKRDNAARAEQITYNIYGDENLAEYFLSLNNQNFLWATPFDLDAFQNAVQFQLNYIEFIMQDRMNNQDVRTIMEERVLENIHNKDDDSRVIIVPDPEQLSFVKRKIKEYFRIRESK